MDSRHYVDEGWLYLGGIMGLYTRKIFGWRINKQMMKKRIFKYMACFSRFHVSNLLTEVYTLLRSDKT
ncbi:hypothetical protein HMPREF0083_01141 [Aneurinibacillus aneurinilyticus ATCC 12856]|uniref:Uncharacterized protein n=1 Tax=Aneurinibacillus aneurinilyticus ATCC 12856 TaxID=649747 RepID=U1WQA3_ANEAE|nr:hypothetical protein HMPREF0083_01141 [Aneurinibacillus aneurinilyticus ATCC 12856]